jgi:hypothetical protein
LEFELLFALSTHESSDRVCDFIVSSGIGRKQAEATVTDGGDHTTFALSIASLNETFGETHGRGRGPFHGLGFELLGEVPFDMPLIDDTDRSPLKLLESLTFVA